LIIILLKIFLFEKKKIKEFNANYDYFLLLYYLIILNVVLLIWIFIFFRSTQLRYNSADAHRIGESNYFLFLICGSVKTAYKMYNEKTASKEHKNEKFNSCRFITLKWID